MTGQTLHCVGLCNREVRPLSPCKIVSRVARGWRLAALCVERCVPWVFLGMGLCAVTPGSAGGRAERHLADGHLHGPLLHQVACWLVRMIFWLCGPERIRAAAE